MNESIIVYNNNVSSIFIQSQTKITPLYSPLNSERIMSIHNNPKRRVSFSETNNYYEIPNREEIFPYLGVLYWTNQEIFMFRRNFMIYGTKMDV
jgi:hypothetical protein